MDPQSTQPQQPAPNPVPPKTPTEPVVAQAPTPPPAENTQPMAVPQPVRPTPNTQVNDSFARPVAPWPPGAQTQPAPVQLSPQANPDPQFSPQVAQAIGLETSEAAGAIPNLGSANYAQAPVVPVAAQDNILGADSSPVAPITPPKDDMTDQQANDLFKEEVATKQRNKKNKIKKVLKIAGAVLLSILVLAGGYIFWFGNSAASSYKNSSSVAAYQSAFAEITDSLSKSPVDSAKLSSGINKLKLAEENTTKLSSVLLGNLNPNYKKAKNLSGAVNSYKETTKGYKDKYSYPDFITALAASNTTVDTLQKLNSQTLVNVEDTLKDIKKISDECNLNTKSLKDAAKPSDLSTASDAYHKALSDICSSLEPTVQAILKDKTGVLSEPDKESVKGALNGVSNSSASLINGSGPSSFYINQLSSYSRSALDEATKLKESAEVILKI